MNNININETTTVAELLSSIGAEDRSGEYGTLQVKYNSLKGLVMSLIKFIEEECEDLDDVKGMLADDRHYWDEHGITITPNLKEHTVYADLKFSVRLTVTANDEDEAMDKAEEYLNDEHVFRLSDGDGIEVDDYNYESADCHT